MPAPAPKEPALNLSPSPGDEVKTTTCYMCACRCGIKVWLADGKIRYIQGNPEHPVNQGVLCAKGSAGIMQHYSPARLDKPLLRVGERGRGEFKEIEWDEALRIATDWLAPIRARNPDELAFFTGRDQSQALTGWWAQQFGTVNYAAHGGFCSVNMAAGGLYTLGGSFWEFGEPDWEHSRYLMLWGVAEDHDSNPIKLGLGKLKAHGAKIVAVNPVRSGYGAIADEWIGIRPGTDGLFAFALIHELLKADRIDLDYLVRYANAHWLVIDNPGGADDGLFARDGEGHPLCWVRDPHPGPLPQAGEAADTPHTAAARAAEAGIVHDATHTAEGSPLPPAGEGQGEGSALRADAIGISPAVVGEYTLPDGRRARPVFHLIAERYLDPQYAPDAVSERCGIPADTIRRIARELAEAAFDHPLTLPIAWTDAHGREHSEMVGRPVSMHAMRGISAHSNGFHTCRALHLLQMLLGAVDTPGSFRYQPPFPKPIAPPNRPGKQRQANGVLDAAPLGFVHAPEDLVVDEHGQPRRIDHAFSWAYPLSAHGMMHSVIRNAWAGDPYKIDTLMMFMANMSWNSAMNTSETIGWLTDKDDSGDYRIPRIIYADAYASEMVAYADLVLPDTTYLERFDAISMLDRPISDAESAIDAIRHPVVDAKEQREGRDVRGFQSVLIDLGARLGLPGLVHEDGSPRYRDYADYIVRHERAPGVGLLAGWRGEHGDLEAKGPPNPQQLDRYIEHGGFWRSPIPEHARYFKMANRGYLDWAQKMGFIGHADPIVLQLYSETLQKFRLAAQGHGEHRPPEQHRERVATYFDPLPIWYEPFEGAQVADSASRYPLSAVTQRPMFMYHAWGSQNAWLRQITARNYLYLHPDTGARHGIADEDWIAVQSHHGRITVQAKFAGNVQPDTVWTWNAIGKRKGAWRLAKDAPEGRKGFLLNHLISDITPRGDYANADPVTGQAAWFDLRVRIERVEPVGESAPQFPPLALGEADNRPLRYGAAFRDKASR
ncbi:molybdopterin oxidoreductase family protein [Lysobacter sp. cf310]|uniref:molybdopterin oxidoreductase family protein n=1 Tax=Lysobacter sp. cf310 TaxID=1761790 RepID=UPI0008E30D58|nr:molybdopterin oxidoreductase family protein [Lysobacter sp. cf310]SFK51541.1 Molydopterin dinucleotide binding domain-containing protein [Lysobacter sp. cf310]